MSTILDIIDEISLEDVAQSIKAAFDSVQLCNDIILTGEKNDKNVTLVKRNKSHLEIMLKKSWFADALTQQQRADIDAAIEASYLFIT